MPKLIIGIVILVAIFFLAGAFIHGKDKIFKNTPLENIATKSSDESACPDPLILPLPVDLDKVTGILYPGQERGGYFKYHGGFRFDNSKMDEIEVRAPLDARITDASRYLEQGKVQYMFDFLTDCGIKYRLDHLATLSPKFAEVVQKLPEAKVDDSRTTRINGEIRVSAGEVIATSVGHPNNVFVDLGVYKSDGFDPFHNFQEDALCFLDMVEASTGAYLRTLPAGVEGKVSTVCK